MVLTVHLFAAAREIAGTESTRIDVPAAATIAELRAGLARRIPALEGLLERSAVAVNHEFAEDGCRLEPNDEVAIIPPVSGG